jgi:CRP-like cAMP-binding protein
MMVQHIAYTKICGYIKARGIFVNDAEQEIFRSVTRHRIISRGTVIMEQGRPVESLYFLNEGIVRLYRVHNEVDHTLGLISSNDFISTPLYLANGAPSTCALEALTDIDVLEWGKEEMNIIRKEFHHGYELEMAIMDRLLTWLQDGQINAICLSAEERYLKLMEEQPEVIRSVPLKYIASFLGIHQDSLSRIRKQVSESR